jgi:hypothetical protein
MASEFDTRGSPNRFFLITIFLNSLNFKLKTDEKNN